MNWATAGMHYNLTLKNSYQNTHFFSGSARTHTHTRTCIHTHTHTHTHIRPWHCTNMLCTHAKC